MTIHWALDREQAERLAVWLDYLEDVIEDYDDDHPYLAIARLEIHSLLAQDRLWNPRIVQAELPLPVGN